MAKGLRRGGSYGVGMIEVGVFVVVSAGAESGSDCDVSSSAKATSSVGIFGAFEFDVAAKTMPPFGSFVAPEKWSINQRTMAKSWACISLKPGVLYADSFITWARPSIQIRRCGRPGRESSWRRSLKI